jgi:hypothetical protein
LVAQRFSAACWKNGQGRSPGQERFDGLPLTFPEARVAEVFEEFPLEVVVWRCHFAGTIEPSGHDSAILDEKQKKRDSTRESLFWQIKLKR